MGRPKYVDEENSYSVFEKDRQSPTECPNPEVFEEYQRKVQIEKRLINKVSEDRELTNLILALNEYKKLYRDLKQQQIMQKEDEIGKFLER